MPPDALLAYVHHLVVFGVGAILAAEIALLSGALPPDRVRSLAAWDGAYGAFSVLALIAGFSRAIWGAKGWAFYAANPVFWIKIGLFVAIGLLSIVPTLRYLRWRGAGTPVDETERRATRNLAIAQAVLFALLPLAAALMARGWGL
jgi:putative membrane protein